MSYIHDMFGLKGKTFFIAGGTGAIGTDTAKALAELEGDVIVSSRDLDKARAASSALGEHGIGGVSLEITDIGSIDRAVEQVKTILAGRPLDGFVMNAGGNRPEAIVKPGMRFSEISDAAAWAVMDLNLRGPEALIRRLIPLMTAAPAPSIVIVGSQAPCGLSRVPHYRGAKSGIEDLGLFLAVELPNKETRTFRVNVVRPGFVAGEQNDFARKDPVRNHAIVNHTPAGRWATPSEIASVIAFLMGRGATVLNGSSIAADLGFEVNKLGNEAI